MDPLSLTAAIVSVAAITTNILRLVQNLSKTNDPSVKLIRAKLMAERRKFANWMLVMRISNMEDLERKIIPEDYQDVKQLVEDIRIYFLQAEDKVRKLNLEGGKSLLAKTKTVSARLRWIYGEFDDLRLLVETLEALNSTLYAIAEPPPKYGLGSEFPEPTARTTRDQDSEGPGTGDLAPLERETPSTQPNSQNRMPILGLYERCLKALRFISSQHKGMAYEQATEKAVFRMKTWAVEFVDGSHSLDRILMNKREEERVHELLRTAIIGTMVDVALIEEQLLGLLLRDSRDRDHRRLEELQLELVAMLGTDDIVKIAVEHSSPVLDEEELDQAIRQAVKCLTSAVNSLYDLLPALRTLRREQVLEAEQQQANRQEHSAEVVVSSGLKANARQQAQNAAEWLEQSIKSASEMERLLLKQEQHARDAGQPVDVVYSQLVSKELERLQEWRNVAQRKGQMNLGEGETERVKKILEKFGDGFSTHIVPTLDTEVELLSSSKPLTSLQKVDEKRIKLFLDYVNSVTNELWQMPNDSNA